jgi:penicillin-binding protein 1A
MAYAHQRIELKPMPGVVPFPNSTGPAIAARPGDEIPRPTLLTKKGVDILVRIERALEDASQALGGPSGTGRTVEATPSALPGRSEGVIAATEGRGRAVRGN